MFFIISKLLLFLLNPFNWIVLCVLLAFFVKKPRLRKAFVIAACCIFYVFSNFALYHTCVRAWQPEAKPVLHNETYNLGIVLTGMSIADKEGNSFFGESSDRFLQTCRLYHTGVIKKILISGGDGSLMQNKPREADFLYREFIAQGIPDTALIVERNSRNTLENAIESKKIVDSLHIPGPYILVTSAIHMRRSMKLFTTHGMNVVPHPANFEAVNSNITFTFYFLPNIATLSKWRPFLKEVIGLWVYNLTGKG